MRRSLIPIAIVLGLHGLAAFASTIYLSFLVDVGGLLVHRNQMEHIPDLLLAGFLLIGGVLVIAAVAVAYVCRRMQLEHSDEPTLL